MSKIPLCFLHRSIGVTPWLTSSCTYNCILLGRRFRRSLRFKRGLLPAPYISKPQRRRRDSDWSVLDCQKRSHIPQKDYEFGKEIYVRKAKHHPNFYAASCSEMSMNSARRIRRGSRLRMTTSRSLPVSVPDLLPWTRLHLTKIVSKVFATFEAVYSALVTYGSEYEAVPVGPATCIMNPRHVRRNIDRKAVKLGDDPTLRLKRSRPPIGKIEQRT